MRRTASGFPPFECIEHVHWSHGDVRDADADGVGDGVADRGADADGRRFAEPDDAALIVDLADIQMDDDIADVLDAGELVELHVGVEHAAGNVVHDAIFKQGGGDAHGNGAVDLAFRQPWVDDEAAILHGHVAIDFDQAGFVIDEHYTAGDKAIAIITFVWGLFSSGLAIAVVLWWLCFGAQSDL